MNDLKAALNMIQDINREAMELREIFQPAEEISKQIASIEKLKEQDVEKLVYLYAKLDELAKKAEPYDISKEEFVLWLHRIKGGPPKTQ